MNITEEVSFSNDGHIERFPLIRKLFLALVIVLVAALSFGIGRLTSVGKSEPIQIEYDASLTSLESKQAASAINSLTTTPISQSLQVVGSSKGTKYHYLHCPGAKQISEANKVTFSSPEAAEASGYVLASNCRPK